MGMLRPFPVQLVYDFAGEFELYHLCSCSCLAKMAEYSCSLLFAKRPFAHNVTLCPLKVYKQGYCIPEIIIRVFKEDSFTLLLTTNIIELIAGKFTAKGQLKGVPWGCG
jgi:hypothetical protein